ncbi:MAG: replication-associated recombination protein A [Actinobacteria bacterium]|jgi:putative ATPase|nr:replication-associated recombination protein A [Actinomycetota bacterium]
MTLFDDGLASSRSSAPLAVRMRPRSLDEVVGQDSALAPGSPLRTLLTAPGDSPVVSVILWGPPGTGKTTLASLLSAGSGRAFVELSAVTAGVKDVRAVIERARDNLSMQGRGTVLFIDEVHRFSKSQQDALLPAVENGWVTLIAATTENPSFSVIAPLLSRSVMVSLSPLTNVHVEELLRRAIEDPRGLGGTVVIEDDALAHLVRTANGDARRALTGLDAAAMSSSATGEGSVVVTLADAERAVQQAAVIYDKDGDQHYDVISAFIKSIRGSDPDAALHYLARMLEAGEDPRFVARRLMIAASEDIGMAEPSVLQTAVAAAQAVAMVGMPEAAIILAHATIHAALAPKSNAVVVGLGAATADVRAGGIGRVPAHLRDGHYPGAAALGHGRGYVYPHDVPGGVAAQEYLPDELVGRTYYRPSTHGAEAAWGDIAARLRELRRDRDR